MATGSSPTSVRTFPRLIECADETIVTELGTG
jgi:hypothetical protein